MSHDLLLNTWMWPLGDDPNVGRIRRLIGSRFGRYLYEHGNFSAKVLLRRAVEDKAKLPPAVHEQYVRALPSPKERQGTWVFARELADSGDWFESLWQRRDRIADKPALIVWGLKDPFIPRSALARWKALFTEAQVMAFEDIGHLPPEEMPDALAGLIESFLQFGPVVTPQD